MASGLDLLNNISISASKYLTNFVFSSTIPFIGQCGPCCRLKYFPDPLLGLGGALIVTPGPNLLRHIVALLCPHRPLLHLLQLLQLLIKYIDKARCLLERDCEGA